MDDATSEHYAMFFVLAEGTAGSFQEISDVILRKGLFSSLCTDRGRHYWFKPKEGGKGNKALLTQFGQALDQLDIHMIAAYSSEARGRSERAFQTHQQRLVTELALHGITDRDGDNCYLIEVYIPAYNAEFTKSVSERPPLSSCL